MKAEDVLDIEQTPEPDQEEFGDAPRHRLPGLRRWYLNHKRLGLGVGVLVVLVLVVAVVALTRSGGGSTASDNC